MKLCRLGLHKWLEFGVLRIMPHATVSECLRCHKRKADYGYATVIQNPPPDGWNDYLELGWTIDMKSDPDPQAGGEGRAE